jgi:hypothetical protein
VVNSLKQSTDKVLETAGIEPQKTSIDYSTVWLNIADYLADVSKQMKEAYECCKRFNVPIIEYDTHTEVYKIISTLKTIINKDN